jgi:hypothetical protein
MRIFLADKESEIFSNRLAAGAIAFKLIALRITDRPARWYTSRAEEGSVQLKK